jgi:hypothetical protein
MSMTMWRKALPLALAALLAGCGGDGGGAGETAGDTSAGTPAGDSGKTVVAPDDAGAWAVTLRGAGPVRVGMTADEAMRALGTRYEPGADAECEEISSSNLPEGVWLMAVERRVVRVDVTQGTVATAEGARIGDPEARIVSLYGGRVEARPHKYTDGKYLVVSGTDPADRNHRLVFETDGEKVTRYRAGALPQVEWVEGCA